MELLEQLPLPPLSPLSRGKIAGERKDHLISVKEAEADPVTAKLLDNTMVDATRIMIARTVILSKTSGIAEVMVAAIFATKPKGRQNQERNNIDTSTNSSINDTSHKNNNSSYGRAIIAVMTS